MGGFVRFVVKALIGLFALFGLLIVVAIGAVALIGTHFARPPAPSIPQSAILELDLRRGVVETRPEGLLARATGTKVSLLADVVEGLLVEACSHTLAVLVDTTQGQPAQATGVRGKPDCVFRGRIE